MQRREFLLKTAASVGVAGLALAGCTATGPKDSKARANPTSRKQDIDANVKLALERLHGLGNNVNSNKDVVSLIKRSHGILVFPSVIGGAFWVGGQYGEGALHINGKNAAYYNIASASFGPQIGAQSKAIFFLFMTPEALHQFRTRTGWSGGVDASVAALTVGANGAIDTRTVQKQPVVAFVLTNTGLMASLALEGTKITKLEL